MYRFFLFVLFLSLAGCDGGLQLPPMMEPGISGIVTFVPETWPPADSVQNLWVFASQIYPLDSASVILGLFSSPPRIFIYPTDRPVLALHVDAVEYNIPLPPATYRYIGVIQRFGTNPFNILHYRVVGVLSQPSDTSLPRMVVVREDQVVTGQDIRVDFYNPPTQPF